MEKLLVKKFIQINSITLLFVYILYSMSIPYMIRLSIGEVDTKYIAILNIISSITAIIFNGNLYKIINKMNISFNILIIVSSILDIIVSIYLIMIDNKVAFYICHSLACSTVFAVQDIKMRSTKAVLKSEDRIVLDAKLSTVYAIGSLISSSLIFILPELSMKTMLILYIGMVLLDSTCDIYIKDLSIKIDNLQKKGDRII